MKSKFLYLLLFVVLIDLFAQETSIRFFSHPGFEYQHHADSGTGNPYFRGGPLILFATSQITENITAGAELNAHYMVETGAEVEIERIFVKYYHNDYISLRVGRMYTPIGFWNLNYNFGLILQPNIARPMALNPTHDGGFALTRDAGIQLEGEKIGKAGLFYKFFLSNGIGKNGGLLGSSDRMGRTNCFTGQIGIEPVDGVKFIASGQFNKLNKGQLNQYGAALPESVDYMVGNFSVVYLNPDKKLEFIAEYFNTQYKYQTLGSHTIQSGVAYLGYKLTDRAIPYVFYESSIFGDKNPYFPSINEYIGRPFQSVSKYDVGFRYKINTNLVFKVEGGLQFEDNYGTLINAKTQLAFAF